MTEPRNRMVLVPAWVLAEVLPLLEQASESSRRAADLTIHSTCDGDARYWQDRKRECANHAETLRSAVATIANQLEAVGLKLQRASYD